MSSDYPRSTAQPRVVTLNGVDYKVARLTPYMLAEIDSWLKKTVPDPRTEVRKLMEGLPEAVQTHIYDRACDEAAYWPPSMFNESGMAHILKSKEGQAELYYIALKRFQPAFTIENARALAETLDIDEFTNLFAVMQPEDVSPPKDEAVIPISATPTTPN